ncbi:MAG: hypothetical protein U0163_10935 [Gemmatimonadaceae bacterium]
MAEIIELAEEHRAARGPVTRREADWLLEHRPHTARARGYERIARTEPYLADEHRSRHVTMDRDLLPSDDTFYLLCLTIPCRGTASCITTWCCWTRRRGQDGDVVAVRMPGDQNLTLRVLKHRGASLVLSGGADGKSVTLGPRDDFTVLGVASGVLRAFVFDQLDNARKRRIADWLPQLLRQAFARRDHAVRAAADRDDGFRLILLLAFLALANRLHGPSELFLVHRRLGVLHDVGAHRELPA